MEHNISAEAFGEKFVINVMGEDGLHSEDPRTGQHIVIPWKFIEGIHSEFQYFPVTKPIRTNAIKIVAKIIVGGTDGETQSVST